MRNAHSRTCSMPRKLKIMENDKHTLQEQNYGPKTLKKNMIMRNTHCRSWNMTRKLKSIENEKDKMQDVKYVEKD